MDPLELRIAKRLNKKKKTLALAESCTGGLISHRITNASGSSLYFRGAIVAYSNKVKESLLSVPGEVIKTYGAVSRQVALGMARAAREVLCSDIAISITGIAGPTGGSAKKPVGLAYIAFASARKRKSKRVIFKGTRRELKEKFTNSALNFLLENI